MHCNFSAPSIFASEKARYLQSSSSSIGTGFSADLIGKKSVPATAPLLTTERTRIRSRRKPQDELNRFHRELTLSEKESLQRDDPEKNLRSNIGTGFSADLIGKKSVPATAPLLTTERTRIRSRRKPQDELNRFHRELTLSEKESLQRDDPEKNLRSNRYYYDGKPGRPMVVMDNVDDIIYGPINLDEKNFMEGSFEDDEVVYTDAEGVVGEAGGSGAEVDAEMQNQPKLQQQGKNILFFVTFSCFIPLFRLFCFVPLKKSYNWIWNRQPLLQDFTSTLLHTYTLNFLLYLYWFQ
ncbi:unnamed protein product [Gongylonema pulchrum]|uniref:Uncharacterized protein n=1 Tax=Gongylonema pulchrum TaxID=637853 RepID=A0A183ESN1_9BILA|nr:unnamed protein product [Gongylonema pulchrum]